MNKIADKKNGTVEDATSYLTCTELFFVCLSVEFIIISLLPFRISPYVMGGIFIFTWYYTHYAMRKSIRATIINSGIRKAYQALNPRMVTRFLMLSIILFFVDFFLFFAIAVWTIGGYYK